MSSGYDAFRSGSDPESYIAPYQYHPPSDDACTVDEMPDPEFELNDLNHNSED